MDTNPEGSKGLFDQMATPEDVLQDPELSQVADQTALAQFGAMPTFSSEDIMMPRIKLTQQLTPEVVEEQCKAGLYFSMGYPAMDTITAIPMLFTRRRILTTPDGSEILCRSNDAVTGVGTPGGPCEGCPMTAWRDTDQGRKAPDCTFMYSYIMYVKEWEMVGIVDFKRTSIPTGKIVNTLVGRKGLGKFGVRLGVSKQTNKAKQTFYQMTVVPAEVDPEDITTAVQLLKFQ